MVDFGTDVGGRQKVKWPYMFNIYVISCLHK